MRKELLALSEFTALVLLYRTIFFCFSKSVAHEIKERDGWKCVNCGYTNHLEAAHLNHTRNYHYDDPENGQSLCTKCHYLQHFNTPTNKLGISRESNLEALYSMWNRMDPAVRKKFDLPHPSDYECR